MSTAGPLRLRPLAALTALVVAAHVLVLQEASLSLTPGEARPVRVAALTTRTVTPTPEAPAVTTPAPPPTPPAPKKPRPVRPPRPVEAPSRPTQDTAISSIQAEPSVERPESAIDSVADSTPAGTVTAPPATPAASLTPPAEALPPVATASAAAARPPLDGATLNASVPSSVRLLYNLTGQARSLQYSARGEVLWRQDGQRYDLRLVVSAFLIGSRSQSSEGDITPQGLAPRRYADKWRGEQAAHFNRDTRLITFSANTPDAPLLPGAQDRLSLFMQVGALMAADPARMAPGTSITLQTVSTREAEPWVITSEGEEQLALPGGGVATYRFTRVPRRQFDTRLDLWIAPSMSYLPVRIRVTQANGDFVDQQLRAAEPAEDLK